MRTARHALTHPLHLDAAILSSARQWGVRSLVFLLCLAAALMLTALRIEITRLTYDLSSLHREKQAVAGEVARLEVESATLAAPDRIEEGARKMGLIYPRPEHVVTLDE